MILSCARQRASSTIFRIFLFFFSKKKSPLWPLWWSAAGVNVKCKVKCKATSDRLYFTLYSLYTLQLYIPKVYAEPWRDNPFTRRVGNPYGSRDLPLDGKIHDAPGL